MTKYRTAYLNSTERARLSDAFYRVMNMPLLLSDHSHLALDEHYEKLLKAKKNHDIGLVGLGLSSVAASRLSVREEEKKYLW